MGIGFQIMMNYVHVYGTGEGRIAKITFVADPRISKNIVEIS